ncbi:hypothetical protein BOX15_Mlig004066g4 [Macrostomum lignano]|uniref:Integrase catalytic domain-containing protein n=1 Tax=Macrostomum lignano TaxID=282301 RepID=A0A267FXU8_9PLAT|nr:hypothetical protein BOX15_Mlig004066g4 [Macrostomum lignano]
MASDALSRLVPQGRSGETLEIGNIHTVSTTVSLEEIRLATKRCNEMRLLKSAIKTGSFKHPRLRPFKNVREELCVQDDVILRGHRIIIPKSLRMKAIAAVHEVHLGMSRTKSLARAEFWWPAMDSDIERTVGLCQICRTAKPQNRNFRSSWPEAAGPWDRVHIDFAGPIDNHYMLVLVDSYSGYPEVHVTKDMTSRTVIQCVRRTFSQLGIPRTLVSDNGPCFISKDFTEWLAGIDCEYLTIAAYHPQSNGVAERFVRTLKESIKANGFSQESVDRFLLFYRASDNKAGSSPAEQLLGHKLRVPFTKRQVGLEDPVIYKNERDKPITAKLLLPIGRSMAMIKTDEPNSKYRKVHLDQLHPYSLTGEEPAETDRMPPGAGEHAAGRKQEEEPPQQKDLRTPPIPEVPEGTIEPRRSMRLSEKPKVNYKC